MDDETLPYPLNAMREIFYGDCKPAETAEYYKPLFETALATLSDLEADVVRRRYAHTEPLKFRRRIGSTVYTATVLFSQTAKETAQDKVLGMIESEMRNSA
jgi:hypothetical protein